MELRPYKSVVLSSACDINKQMEEERQHKFNSFINPIYKTIDRLYEVSPEKFLI